MADLKAKYNDVSGIFTDPFHNPVTAGANVYSIPSPWLGGLRVLASLPNDASKFVCLGCDDGVHFWVLRGSFSGGIVETTAGAGRAATMDFAPKAPTVGLLHCSYAPGALSFLGRDGGEVENTWSRLAASPDFVVATLEKHDAFNALNGMWIDPALRKDGTFKGLRVASDRIGKFVRTDGRHVVLGTDDGINWNVISEGVTLIHDVVDFGEGGLGKAKIMNGSLVFFDDCQAEAGGSRAWIKVTAGTDFHALPRAE